MLLEVGDIIELKEGHTVYANVPKHFLFSNHKGNFEIGHGEATIGGELSYLAGRYAVYETRVHGGGTGSTMTGAPDSYPDGHHVFCHRLGHPEAKLDFYQTGCFTAMIKDIEPVGKAVLSWIEPPGPLQLAYNKQRR